MLLAHGEKGEKINRFSRELTSLEKGGGPAQLVEEFQQNHFLKLQISQKNAMEGRTGTDILQKSPVEMRNMLIERMKFVTA